MEQPEKDKKGWSEHQNKLQNPDLPWKAWGSWFSWGSPIGLSLGWGIFFVSTTVGIYLLHLAGVIK